MSKTHIERRIVIGLIVSTQYIKEIRDLYSSKILESSLAKRLAAWCIEYFDKYQKAPGKDIEAIYHEKLKKGLPDDIAEEIEEDILPDLNDEFIEQGVNVEYLVDQTKEYFSERMLLLHTEHVQGLIEQGNIQEAEDLALNYKPPVKDMGDFTDFRDVGTLDKIEKAFNNAKEPLIKYPKQLGYFLNGIFGRGDFVSFMAPEKTGKTWLLLDLITRAARQKIKVAFFQAGDMGENEQIRRFGIHIAKKSDKKKYCGKMHQPVRDCVYNQLDTCDKEERECDFGVFEHLDKNQIRNEMTIEELKQAYKENPDYRPCHNCKAYETEAIGAIWLEEIVVEGDPLEAKEAKEHWDAFFIKRKRDIRMSTHATGTLSISKMNSILDKWEEDGFKADLIVFDYAGIAKPEKNTDHRHQQNQIWMDMRATSQKRNALLVTVDQTDAASYKKNILTMDNFSEDKRKFGHVTAMIGMNQDPYGREKKLGILRLNKVVVREDEFTVTKCVYVLQNLKRGMPVISSYF